MNKSHCCHNYSNLDVKNVTEKRLKVFFLDKTNNFENISLAENSQVVTHDKEVAGIFLEYFDNIVPILGLQVSAELISPTHNPD